MNQLKDIEKFRSLYAGMGGGGLSSKFLGTLLASLGHYGEFSIGTLSIGFLLTNGVEEYKIRDAITTINTRNTKKNYY